MEKPNYWTWSKRKHTPISHIQPPITNPNSYRDSWEEQAFAVDAAGVVGGCVWPPRSYSCSFCRQEFRSAQALGGHMNVHRMDRARLNQYPYPHKNEILRKHKNHQDHIPNICIPSLGCNAKYPDPDRVFFSYPSSASRVLSHENCDERNFLPTVSPPNSIKKIDLRILSTPSLCSNLFVSDKCVDAVDSDNTEEIVGPKGGATVNLNMVVCQIRRAGDGKEEGVSCKTRRNSTADSNSSGGNSSTPLQSEVVELSSTSTEEEEEEEEVIDLQLRLGYVSACGDVEKKQLNFC